jgi:hypothetical protein
MFFVSQIEMLADRQLGVLWAGLGQKRDGVCELLRIESETKHFRRLFASIADYSATPMVENCPIQDDPETRLDSNTR